MPEKKQRRRIIAPSVIITQNTAIKSKILFRKVKLHGFLKVLISLNNTKIAGKARAGMDKRFKWMENRAKRMDDFDRGMDNFVKKRRRPPFS